MSDHDKKTRDEVYKLTLDTDLAKKFNSEMGATARIEREEVTNELSVKANAKLRDLGAELNPMIDSLNYKGSCAVHVYESKVLGHIFFMTQAQTMQDVDELIGSKALDDLRGTMMEMYGRKRKVKRSGF